MAQGLVEGKADGGYDEERDRQKHEDEPGRLAAHLRGRLRDAEDVDENAGKGFQKTHTAEDKPLVGCAGGIVGAGCIRDGYGASNSRLPSLARTGRED
jgi:hypothetical protein